MKLTGESIMIGKKDVDKIKVFKALIFKLTIPEIAEKGQEAAETRGLLNEDEHEFDGIKQTWKGIIQQKELKLEKLLSLIRAGEEERVAECLMIKDYNRNLVQYVYDDKIMEERAMELSERQPELIPTKLIEAQYKKEIAEVQ
jgi:hypothetical protein